MKRLEELVGPVVDPNCVIHTSRMIKTVNKLSIRDCCSSTWYTLKSELVKINKDASHPCLALCLWSIVVILKWCRVIYVLTKSSSQFHCQSTRTNRCSSTWHDSGEYTFTAVKYVLFTNSTANLKNSFGWLAFSIEYNHKSMSFSSPTPVEYSILRDNNLSIISEKTLVDFPNLEVL